MMELVICGVNHRTLPVALRERLAVAPPAASDLLAELRTEGVEEGLVLSTCNRVEVYGVGAQPDVLRGLMVSADADTFQEVPDCAYSHQGLDAVRHFFRVTAGLDSMVVGETQILGQVKEAYRLANEAGATGPIVEQVCTGAFKAAKRVHTETGLGEGAVSVPYAACELIRKIYSPLNDNIALLVGTGEMGALAARHLLDSGVGELRIANRTDEKAEELAKELGATFVSWKSLEKNLAEVDIVITATGAPEPIITAEMVYENRSRSGGRQLVIVDIAVPRDVAPEVSESPDVFLYTIDDLERIVGQNLLKRKDEVDRAEAIVEEAVSKLVYRRASLEATPVIKALLTEMETVRKKEIEKAIAGGSLDAESFDAVTRSLVQKILHMPLNRLKAYGAGTPEERARLNIIRDLFGLDDPDEGLGA